MIATVWPATREIETTAETRAIEISSTEKGCWQFTGQLSAGKSTLLKRLALRLRERGLHPILLSPPSRSLDAGAIAFGQLASQLCDVSGKPERFDSLIGPEHTFDDKFERVSEWLKEDPKQMVLLCDEPTAWLPNGRDAENFRDPLLRLFRILFDEDGPRIVVAGDLPDGRTTRRTRVLEVNSDSKGWLEDGDEWGSFLAAPAQSLAQADEASLRNRSPLELRLMVALISLGMTTSSVLTKDRRSLATLLTVRCQSDPACDELHSCWGKLALFREGFTDQALMALGAPDENCKAGQILRRCLLFEEANLYILHELLRADIATHFTSAQRAMDHMMIAKSYYAVRLQDLTQSGASVSARVTCEMEGYYHASAGWNDSLGFTPYFFGQLQYRGHLLLRQYQRPEFAAEVFREALAWRPDDGFCHFSIAYCLDVQAGDFRLVEEHYRRALEANQRRPSWWAAWICYLLSRGRTVAAEQQWSRCLDALAPDMQSWEETRYGELQAPIAALALTRGCLALARNVLDTVPDLLRNDSVHFATCQSHLRALEIENEGKAVTPYPYRLTKWWTEGPFLVLREQESKCLSRWYAAHVEHVGKDEVELRLGICQVEQDSEPEILFTTIPMASLRGWLGDSADLQEGDFLEIGVYGSDEAFKAVRHSRVALGGADKALARIYPDPDRYLVAS